MIFCKPQVKLWFDETHKNKSSSMIFFLEEAKVTLISNGKKASIRKKSEITATTRKPWLQVSKNNKPLGWTAEGALPGITFAGSRHQRTGTSYCISITKSNAAILQLTLQNIDKSFFASNYKFRTMVNAGLKADDQQWTWNKKELYISK